MSSGMVVAGLGVAGLGCSVELADRGIGFRAFEKESRPGGLARSEPVEGFRFDYGPHVILGVPPELEPLFSSLPGLGLQQRNARSCIALGQDLSQTIPVPFQRNLNRLAIGTRVRILLDLLAVRNGNGHPPSNYAELGVQRCGKTAFDLFLRGYEAKRLRCRLEDLPCEWARRVSAVRPAAVLRPAWLPGPVSEEGGFLYPQQGGMEALPGELAGLLPAASVHCGESLAAIDWQSRRLTFASGRSEHFESLAAAIPLPELVRCIENPPSAVLDAASHLPYTSVHVVNLGLEGSAPPWSVMRFPGHGQPFYRLTFPSSYAPDAAPPGYWSLVAEVSYHESRHPIAAAEALQRCKAALRRLGLLRGQTIAAECVFTIRYAHVLYDNKTVSGVALLLDWLARHGVFPAGKYGLWRDLLMTDSILSGMETGRRMAAPYRT